MEQKNDPRMKFNKTKARDISIESKIICINLYDFKTAYKTAVQRRANETF